MRILLIGILFFVTFVAKSQCSNCNTVDEAVLDTITTSEVLYYDGSNFQCIDRVSQLNEILGSADSMLCLLNDSIAYYVSITELSDSMYLLADSLIDNISPGVFYSITSIDSSIIIVSENDSVFDISLNIDKVNEYIFNGVDVCDESVSINSFNDAITYLCDKYVEDTLVLVPKEPGMTIKTSSSDDTMKFEITPFVSNFLESDDCSSIYYYYNVYDSDTVVVPNGSGIWNGGSTYGQTNTYYIPMDLTTETYRVDIDMRVYRSSCYSGNARPVEIKNNGFYVFEPSTPNCGWGTGSGTWNTLNGKWCSE